MNRSSALSACLLLLFSATICPKAQEANANRLHAQPLIQTARIATTPSGPTGLLPAQYKAAYEFNFIPNRGQGQTIAVIGAYDDPNVASDLAFYASYFHLTPCNFQKVEIGNPAQGNGWDLAESLGVEQACALAPQANIILVEATSDSFTDLFDAIALASTAPYNATVVSMGWGGTEFNGEQQYDSYFCNIVNGNGQPVTFVAAAGGMSYPAASPCVIAAGGTTLGLSSTAPPPSTLQTIYGSECAYGFGGISDYESEPSWQDTACAPYSPNGYRCMPDIASDANPSTGVPVYDTYSFGGWVEAGGTGVSAADWGAFFTLVNSQRVIDGASTLSQAAPDMYTIYYSSNYPTDFHDITCGSGAGPGYDLATGIGSYKANNLFTALVADTN
jgi:subtilase family serine protease